MKPVYTGIFFDKRTYNQLKAIAATLEKDIENPHLTLEFKPKELLADDIIGQEIELLVIGEGNNGINQGLQVSYIDPLEKLYKNASIPHITVSLDPIAGKAVNTGKLNFNAINPFTIKGRIGYFTGKDVRFHN